MARADKKQLEPTTKRDNPLIRATKDIQAHEAAQAQRKKASVACLQKGEVADNVQQNNENLDPNGQPIVNRHSTRLSGDTSDVAAMAPEPTDNGSQPEGVSNLDNNIPPRKRKPAANSTTPITNKGKSAAKATKTTGKSSAGLPSSKQNGVPSGGPVASKKDKGRKPTEAIKNTNKSQLPPPSENGNSPPLAEKAKHRTGTHKGVANTKEVAPRKRTRHEQIRSATPMEGNHDNILSAMPEPSNKIHELRRQLEEEKG
jgi:hypothetical protein